MVEEIEDEYDIKVKPTQWVRRLSSKECIVSARIELDTLEREFYQIVGWDPEAMELTS